MHGTRRTPRFRVRRALVAAGLFLLTLYSPSFAQLFKDGDSGPREILARSYEIALARSAAPPEVSEDATVFVLGANGYDLAVQGTSGTACYVSRAWKASIEPHCFDREGAATVMRINMRRVELLHAGKSLEEANAVIAAGLLDGEFRLPGRPAMSWMMSSAQELINSEGKPAGAWRPHLMIYYPFLTEEGMSLDRPPSQPIAAVLSNAGTPLSNLVVVVTDFIDPVPVDARAEPTP